MKAQHNHDSLESKANILYLKSHALDKDIAKEQQNNKRLIRTMPVKLNARNDCKTTVSAAVDSALKELDKFYDVYISNTNCKLNSIFFLCISNLRTLIPSLSISTNFA